MPKPYWVVRMEKRQKMATQKPARRVLQKTEAVEIPKKIEIATTQFVEVFELYGIDSITCPTGKIINGPTTSLNELTENGADVQYLLNAGLLVKRGYDTANRN